MIDFISEWIFNLAAVGILLVLIDILAPSGKSKKVINLVSGLILILTIVQPFFNLLYSDIGFNELYDQNNEYVEAIMDETGKFASVISDNFDAEELKEKQSRQIINIYGKRIAENIGKMIMEVEEFQKVEVDLIIDEDYDSHDYGKIKKIYVNAYLSDTVNEESDGRYKTDVKIEKIEEVRIDPINKNSDSISNRNDDNDILLNTNNRTFDNRRDKMDAELVKKLEEKVILATGVGKENTIVSVIRR